MMATCYRNVLTFSRRIISRSLSSGSTDKAKFIPLIEGWRSMPLEEQYSLVMFCDVSNESEMSYQKGWLSIQSTDPFTYQACKSFDDVIVLKPDWVEAYIGRAFCWRIMEQQKLAKADFAMALRLDPERAKKAFAEYCELLKNAAKCQNDKTIPANIYDLPEGYSDCTLFRTAGENYSLDSKNNSVPELR